MSRENPQQVPTLAVWIQSRACSICRNPDNGFISDLLVIRSRRGSLANGQKVTGTYLIQHSVELFGQQYSSKTFSRHLSNHLRPHATTAGAAVANEQAAVTEVAALFAALDPVSATPRDLAQAIVRAAALKLRRNPEQVTLQLGIEAARLMERSQVDDQAARLMGLLGGAISAAVAPPRSPVAVVEAEAAEVVEAEVVEGS